MMKCAIYKFVYEVIKDYFAFYLLFIIASAISTEFNAAPRRRLSETIQRFKEFFFVLSSLILEIKVSFFPAASIGVAYPPFSFLSMTEQPGESFKTC